MSSSSSNSSISVPHGIKQGCQRLPLDTKVTERRRITPAGPTRERFRLLDAISMKDWLRRTVPLARHAKEQHFSSSKVQY